MPVVPEGQPEATRPAHELYELAMKRLSEGDRNGAFAACQAAREIDPDQPDYALLATWIRAILGGSNLESCVNDLDKLLEERPDHVPSLFYRGYLRRRTGDESGAVTDLHRVLELDPTHQDALRELKRIERRAPAKRPSGLYQS
jgi:cytochrome c-type biogenesis protein CcmH/NrfG